MGASRSARRIVTIAAACAATALAVAVVGVERERERCADCLSSRSTRRFGLVEGVHWVADVGSDVEPSSIALLVFPGTHRHSWVHYGTVRATVTSYISTHNRRMEIGPLLFELHVSPVAMERLRQALADRVVDPDLVVRALEAERRGESDAVDLRLVRHVIGMREAADPEEKEEGSSPFR